jgi:hypothetical protein
VTQTSVTEHKHSTKTGEGTMSEIGEQSRNDDQRTQSKILHSELVETYLHRRKQDHWETVNCILQNNTVSPQTTKEVPSTVIQERIAE